MKRFIPLILSLGLCVAPAAMAESLLGVYLLGQPLLHTTEKPAALQLDRHRAVIWDDVDEQIDYDSQSLQWDFPGVSGEWSPSWLLTHERQSLDIQWDESQLQYDTTSTQVGVGMQSASGWGVLMGPHHYRLQFQDEPGQRIFLGYTDRRREDRLSLMSPLTGDDEESFQTNQSYVTLGYEVADSAVDFRQFESGGAAMSVRLGQVQGAVRRRERTAPPLAIEYEGADVRLSFGQLSSTEYALSWRPDFAAAPLFESVGTSVTTYEGRAVLRSGFDADTARLSLSGELVSRSAWVSVGQREWNSLLQLTWLTGGIQGVATSNFSDAFAEDFDPLDFTDALVVGSRVRYRWPFADQFVEVWAQQWLPVAAWGDPSDLDLPDPPDDDEEPPPDDPDGEPGEPSIGSDSESRPYGGFMAGVRVRF